MIAFLSKLDEPVWWWVQHKCNEAYRWSPSYRDGSRGAMKRQALLSGWTRGAIYMHNPVASYSGGWRMKTQLAAAKPRNADVLMLNEPTGHRM